MYQTPLRGIGPEEVPLPGIKPAGSPPAAYTQPPILVAVEDDPIGVSPDQLTFGPNQMPLVKADPQPQQLSLLPDPPVWEEPANEPPAFPQRPGRLYKRRSRARIGPGQGSLF